MTAYFKYSTLLNSLNASIDQLSNEIDHTQQWLGSIMQPSTDAMKKFLQKFIKQAEVIIGQEIITQSNIAILEEENRDRLTWLNLSHQFIEIDWAEADKLDFWNAELDRLKSNLEEEQKELDGALSRIASAANQSGIEFTLPTNGLLKKGRKIKAKSKNPFKNAEDAGTPEQTGIQSQSEVDAMKSNKVGKSVPERLIFGDKESSKITLLVDGPKSNGQNEAKELFEIFYDPRKKKFRLASGNGGNLVLRAVNNLNVHMDVSVLYRDLKFIVQSGHR